MREVLKSIPKFMYAIFLVVVLIIILICIPFDKLEKRSKQDTPDTTQTSQVDNSGDIGSINDKIKQDNDVLGVSSEEVSTEEENPFDYGTADVSEDITSDVDSMDFNSLTYSYTPMSLYSKYVVGEGADLDKIRPVLIDENDDVLIRFADLVLVSHFDDNTTVFKLNKETNDLFIYHSIDKRDDALANRDVGSINTISIYMCNLSIQQCGDKEVLVGTYEVESSN